MNPKTNVVSLQDHARPRRADELDLLGRLFERIAADTAIPPAVRAELSRLRIPTLRAAQLEHDFIANRMHPARHLIDAVAAAAGGLDETA
jgi:hypothetical protein